jgi:hypothetical protein
MAEYSTTELPEMFDPSQEEGTKFDPLPIGVYLAQIIEAAVTVPQSLDGYGINTTWEIIEGEYEGRRVWQRIILQHSSTEAQRIGRRELKDLCDACGISKGFNSVEPLKFIHCKIRVGIEKDKNGVYDDKNKVTRVCPASKGPPISSQVSAPKPPVPPSAAAATARPSAAAATASSAATSIKTMMEGVRFTNYQPPDPPQTPPQTSPQTSSSVVTDKVKAMIIALRTRSRLSPQEISEEMAKIDVKISTITIESLLVAWNKYDIGVAAGSRATNGGGTSQAAPQTPPSQTEFNGGTPSQASAQPLSQTPPQAAHSDTLPWRK